MRVASRVERAPLCLDAGRTLGLDLVLAVRAGDHPDLTAVLDIEERGVADVSPAGVDLVEHGGDLGALVILRGEPLPRCPSPGPVLDPRPDRDD